MPISIRKALTGWGLIPVAATAIDTKGEMEVLSSDGRYYWHDGSAVQKIAGIATTDVLTNKTISGSSNTLTNIPLSAATGTLGVANGGTGAVSLNAHTVLIGAGTGAIYGATAGVSGQVFTGTSGNDPVFSSTPTLGIAGTTLGTLAFCGNTSGTITIQPQAIAGTYNFNLPASAGTAGQPLLSGGGSGAAQTYGTLAIAAGGTGQVTKAAAFDALSPMSASGDIIYGGASGTGTRLAKGSDTQVLTLASGVPTWATPSAGGTGSLNAKFSLGGAIVPYTCIDGPHYQTATQSLTVVNISALNSGSSGSTTIQVNQYRSGSLQNSATASLSASSGNPAGSAANLSGTLSLLAGDIITVDVNSIAGGLPSELTVEY